MQITPPNELKLVSLAIGFHDSVCRIGKIIYRGIVPPKIDVAPETAHANIAAFTERVIEKANPYGGEQKVESLEDKLESFGDHYVSREDLTDQSNSLLWQTALAYDMKGIIPSSNENIIDFVYRGNTLLFLHRQLKQNRYEPRIIIKEEDVQLAPSYCGYKFAQQEDIEEANRRIPYFMDLSWVAVYVKKKEDLLIPALGLTFTLPQYNGFNFIHMRSEYKSREQFISVLAHEITHAGTVHFDTKRKYLETKAYAVGKGDLMLGEYAVALNASPRLWMKVIEWTNDLFLRIPLPNKYFKILPKVRSAIEILDNTNSYREVEGELKALYGNKGGYILGRLNADELEELRDTNNIPARIAMKKDLKWQIMQTNFATLE